MKYSFFSEDEIKCNCGCGLLIVQQPHFFRINLLRQALKEPVVVTSWCRCHSHNEKSGGTLNSSHLFGWATDIKAVGNLSRIKVIFYAGALGFNGVGVGSDFIHLDSDPLKRPDRFWTY